MIKAGIVGASGYAGEALIDILLKHAHVRITGLYAKIDKPLAISELFPRLRGKIDLICKEIDIKEIINNCDLVFLALPHTVSMGVVPALLAAKKPVIDLSADYRLKDSRVYRNFYQVDHKDKINLKKSVYGLPELYRENISKANFIANPGCYPTAAILGLAPLVATEAVDLDSIIIDAKSGSTGAGRKLSQDLLFSEIEGDFRAYKVNSHQHMPEINQELGFLAQDEVRVSFVPHLLPLARGILETIYVKKSKKSKIKKGGLTDFYKKFYKLEPFVRVRDAGDYPNLKAVVGTNFCDIGIQEDGDKAVIISVIDNLMKGASGQAVQNMNILCKFEERTGLL
ncbi:MAG: N-acetyl-gamma-glutamyl-phosphate reductase [Candidatus Omnitrophica bacterium]|nr:N-acetyl-gamma-glutamyl-phosphate reductase [Candidatus Omnitrophota bacterium]